MKFFSNLVDKYRVWLKKVTIRKRINKLPYNESEFDELRNVKFLTKDYPSPFDRYLLLGELQKKNPHIQDLLFQGDHYKVYLGAIKPPYIEVDDSCPGYKGKECGKPRHGHKLCVNCFRDSIHDDADKWTDEDENYAALDTLSLENGSKAFGEEKDVDLSVIEERLREEYLTLTPEECKKHYSASKAALLSFIGSNESEKSEKSEKSSPDSSCMKTIDNLIEQLDPGHKLRKSYEFNTYASDAQNMENLYRSKTNDELAHVINTMSKFSGYKSEINALDLARKVATERIDEAYAQAGAEAATSTLPTKKKNKKTTKKSKKKGKRS